MNPQKRQVVLALFLAIILLPIIIFLFRAEQSPYLLTLLFLVAVGYVIVKRKHLRG
jgi:hypothetical protein